MRLRFEKVFLRNAIVITVFWGGFVSPCITWKQQHPVLLPFPDARSEYSRGDLYSKRNITCENKKQQCCNDSSKTYMQESLV
jgi:hypothetical protein